MPEQENENKDLEDSIEDASKQKETRPDPPPLITVIHNPYVKKLKDKFKRLGLR
jgi:hypothetical protein